MKKLKKIITFLLMLLAFTFTNHVDALSSGNNGNGKGNADGTRKGSDRGDHGENTGNQGNDKQKGNTNKRKNTSVPLDGGLSVLILGAAAFGVKKLRDNKK